MESKAIWPDSIRINDLVLPISLRTGAQWSTEGEYVDQPISISLSISSDISQTVKTDDLTCSINYADMATQIRATVASATFLSLQDLSRSICDLISAFKPLAWMLDGLKVGLRVIQLKAPLHCKTVSIEHIATFSSSGSWTTNDSGVVHSVEDLTCPTIIGINSVERIERQDVVVNLSVEMPEDGFSQQNWVDFRTLTRTLYEKIGESKFLTLEALTSFVASTTLSILKSCPTSPVVSVRVAKPSALTFASSPEVQIRRIRSDYPESANVTSTISPLTTSENSSKSLHKAAIAIGSNLGDSFRNIEYALRLLEIPQDIMGNDYINLVVTVVNTSFLYETAPMYVTDQPSFINCACMVDTNLSPILLLKLLKKIEHIVGRVPSIRNGPRAVDLDVIFYENELVDTRSNKTSLDNLEGHLVIPHPRLQEREFVLRPLSDMIPDYIHPILKQSVNTLFRAVCDPTAPPMNKVLPYPRFPLSASYSSSYSAIAPIPETLCHWTYPSSPKAKGQKTHVMATLNVTPDSFSDGATNDTLPAALAYSSASVTSGATIIDIGGYSTRPGAAFVGVDDEISRVVPVVQTLRNLNANESQLTAQIPISVDTFRWEVAEAAIKAGANCINDVYAFTGPDSWPPSSISASEYMTKLKAVAREHAVPVVLMHSRGDAGKNKDYSEYQYSAEPTLEGVRLELGAKIDKIVLGKGGVRRWLVIVDPGIGFSKTIEGNLEVLRGARHVVEDVMIGHPRSDCGPYRNPLRGYPQLIGVSRKSFLGAILAQGPAGRETTPKERTFATAAAVTCAVQQGALIVRVHDVKEMMDVVKVAAAL